jgi:hypothetical protein
MDRITVDNGDRLYYLNIRKDKGKSVGFAKPLKTNEGDR